MSTWTTSGETDAHGLFGEVDVLNLFEFAAEDRNCAVVDDRVRASRQGLHHVGQATASEQHHLNVAFFVASESYTCFDWIETERDRFFGRHARVLVCAA